MVLLSLVLICLPVICSLRLIASRNCGFRLIAPIQVPQRLAAIGMLFGHLGHGGLIAALGHALTAPGHHSWRTPTRSFSISMTCASLGAGIGIVILHNVRGQQDDDFFTLG